MNFHFLKENARIQVRPVKRLLLFFFSNSFFYLPNNFMNVESIKTTNTSFIFFFTLRLLRFNINLKKIQVLQSNNYNYGKVFKKFILFLQMFCNKWIYKHKKFIRSFLFLTRMAGMSQVRRNLDKASHFFITTSSDLAKYNHLKQCKRNLNRYHSSHKCLLFFLLN